MNLFKLPDLGEGLTEAEIVEWHVEVGARVEAHAPLVSVETAKAVVEIPAPRPGRIARRFGEVGDIVQTGAPLVEFGDGAPVTPVESSDPGSVVGEVKAGGERIREPARTLGAGSARRATPAVRALARRLDVDLSLVSPSGPGGSITASDVQRVGKRLAELGPPEILHGVRRAMAVNMSQAHAEVVPATVVDDADVDAWPAGTDVTIRLLRAVAAGCRAQPALNAWFDGHSMGRRILPRIDVAIAVDTPEGLFVPVLRDVGGRNDEELRQGLERLKADVAARTVPPAEMRGYSIILSNFGMIAGRYAAPVLLPPTVAILGAGRVAPRVVAVDGRPVVHRMLPLSLTFDHRAVTGGEAGRFLAAAIADLTGATAADPESASR